MRDSNFRSVAGNRASMSITTTLYDRRALDCTSDKPLVNSLNHLTYLLSTSARIRETICMDGGLERLVEILKECRDDGRPRDGSTNPVLIAWKWTLTLQCLVFLGTRGSEKVRRRVVESGSIPVIATVLDNHLQTLEKIKAHQLAMKQCNATMDSNLEPKLPPSTMNSTTPSLHPTTAASTTAATPANTLPSSANASIAINTHAPTANGTTPTLSASNLPVLASNASVFSVATNSTASLFDDSASISTATTVSSTTSSAILSEYSSVSGSAVPDDRMPRSTSSTTATFAHNVLHQATAPRGPTNLRPVGTDHRIYSQASNAVFFAHAHARPHHHLGDVQGHQGSENEARRREPRLDGSPSTSAGTSANASTAPTTSIENDTGADQLRAGLPAPTVREPTPDGLIGEVTAGDVQAIDGENVPAVGVETGMGMEVPTRTDQRSMSNGWSQSVTIPRYFHDHVIVARDEDVIWALEILAFVSKYAYLKTSLQELNLVPRLSIRDPMLPPLRKAAPPESADDMANTEDTANTPTEATGDDSHLRMDLDDDLDADMDAFSSNDEDNGNCGSECGDADKFNYDSYDFEADQDVDEEYLGDLINIFPLVEKFTIKTFPKEIQYWAGVIMRNSCRKDESRGGIRQCASFACGKWEEYPRQFAKCRRCKRTKYCSKDCQLNAWALHRYWCVPSNGSSTGSGSSSRSAQSHHSHSHAGHGHAHAHAHAHRDGTATQEEATEQSSLPAVATR